MSTLNGDVFFPSPHVEKYCNEHAAAKWRKTATGQPLGRISNTDALEGINTMLARPDPWAPTNNRALRKIFIPVSQLKENQ